METPSLHLKFTPLLTNAVVDKAKCCLEIVPEVTCVQNLDKITWKQDKELVEYTIPMTYKIIIKKRDEHLKTVGNLEAEFDKTYYSCVDLRSSSSMNLFFAACRCDVAKFISDTYILDKISPKAFYCKSSTDVKKTNYTKIIQNECPAEPIADHKENVNIHTFPEEPFVDEILSINVHDMKDNAIEDKAYIAKDEIVNYFIDKITNTEHVNNKTHSVETITDISARGDEPKKLSLTPICSIDTNNLRFAEITHKRPLTYVVNHVFECVPRDLATTMASRLPTRNKKQFNLKNLYDWDDRFTKNVCTARKRELPEVRVAKFIKKMETEIMPLKQLLNEIILKCSTLDLPKLSKTKHGNLMFYATVSNPKDKVEENESVSKDQTESNRVVYSFVFDG